MDEQIYHIPIGTSILRNGITLTLTEDGWRAELQHSMMRRCKGWDYCRPWKYEQGVSHVKRWQCLFLNDIAAQLTVI